MSFFSLKQALKHAKQKFPAFGARVDEAEAVSAWPAAVGEQIAKHARALWVRDGTHLVVEVDHPAWQTELTHMQAKILKRLQEVNAGITSLEFRDRGSLRARAARLARSDAMGRSPSGRRR